MSFNLLTPTPVPFPVLEIVMVPLEFTEALMSDGLLFSKKYRRVSEPL